MSETVTNPVAIRDKRIANLKPFVKGQSGNPSGRPKKSVEVQKTAEDHISDALNVLVKSMKSDNEKVRIRAANSILDRGLGKPKQSVEVNRQPRTLDEITTDDLIAAVQSSRDSDGTTEAETSH